MATAALILAIISFFFDPLYLVSFVAWVLGLVSLIINIRSHKPFAKSLVAFILAICATTFQVVMDTVIVALLGWLFGVGFLAVFI